MSLDLQNIINASMDIKDDFQDTKVDEALDMLVRHFKEIGENQIDITWCVDDIRCLGYECTDEEGMEVLDLVLRKHDAEYGVNYDVLEWYCSDFKLKKTKELDKDFHDSIKRGQTDGSFRSNKSFREEVSDD